MIRDEFHDTLAKMTPVQKEAMVIFADALVEGAVDEAQGYDTSLAQRIDDAIEFSPTKDTWKALGELTGGPA